MDAAILFSDILVVPHGLGQQVDFREGEGPVLDPVESAADLARLDLNRIGVALAPVYEAVARISGELPSNVTLIGFAGAPWTVASYMVEGSTSRDFARVKAWAYGDPAGFKELVNLLVKATVEHLSRQIGAGAEVVQLFDSWAGVLPDEQFQLWCVEPVAEIVTLLKARHPHIPVIGFPRGAGGQYLGYATNTGVDCVGLDTTVPLDWAVERLSDARVLQGNLDPVALITGGEAMRSMAATILERLAGRPLVFNLGHGILPSTPPEHVAELCELLRADGD